MAQKTWGVGEEVLAADFNSYVQNQVIPQFASVAARDAGWTAPPVGAMCVTTDTGSMWQRFTGLWYRPYTVQGYAKVTAAQGGIVGTVVDVTGLTVTFTTPGNRRIMLSVHAAAQSTVANDFVRFDLTDSAGTTTFAQSQVMVTGSNQVVPLTAFETPSSGSVTYKQRVVRSAGTGTITMQASAVQPAYLVAQDVGPV